MANNKNIMLENKGNNELEDGEKKLKQVHKKIDTESMSHGAIIEQCVGAFNRWQLMVCLAVFFINFPLVWNEMVQMIHSPTMLKYNCATNGTDKCSKDCDKIEFDHSEITWTIKEQWSLICANEWLAVLSQTILMLGILAGNVTFGLFSDKFGRRKPILVAVCLQIVSGISMPYAPWFWLFLVLRFTVGVSTGGTHLIAFCIIMEVVGRKYRTSVGILFQFLYYLGHALLGVIGLYIRDWRNVQLVISVPSVLLLSYFFILPESPRWLLTKNRLDEAIAVLEKGAKCNKMPTEHIRNTVYSNLRDNPPGNGNIFDLVKTANMRIKTFCICFNWLVLGVSFFGIAHYMGQIGGNMFMNMIITGLVQIPGIWIIIPMMSKVGRKYTLMVMYVFCAVAVFLIPAMPLDPRWLIIFLGCLGIVGVSLAFSTMFVYSGELYPTVIRNVGMGVSSMFSKLGATMAPFINNLEHIHFCLPPIIYGTGPLLACFICLRLPETLDTLTPDTVEEAEAFGKKAE